MKPGGRPSATIPLEVDASLARGKPDDALERLAQGLLVFFALVLPFEAPLFRLGPLQITSVELALYALLSGWGLILVRDILSDGCPWRPAMTALREDSMVRAAALWCIVLFVSAATAPSGRGAALKFALRSLSGVLAFFAARKLVRSPASARRLVLALVAGALVSAMAAALDAMVPASSAALGFFRAGSFETLGLGRASGVFAYPTIGAMYWEAAVPLVVVAGFLDESAIGPDVRSPASTLRVTMLALTGCALLVGAILASATRAALVGAAVACVVLAGLTRRKQTRVARVAVGALGVLAVSLALAMSGSGSRLGQRLRWWHDDRWLRVDYAVGTTPRVVAAGDSFTVPVTLRNTGALTWHKAGDQPTRLAYHWERLAGPSTLRDYEGQRTELPADVPPGGSVEILAAARSPAEAGTYRLRFDVVEEGVAWFSDQGNAMPEREVEVSAGGQAPALDEWARAPRPPTSPPPPSRPALWRAAVVLWQKSPFFGIGPDNFRRRYPTVLSAAPNGQPYTDARIHANSLYFETLADLGIVGVAALIAIFLALVRIIRALRAGHGVGGVTGLGCAVAAGTFFVHGGLDYFFEFTPLFGLFWLLLGTAAACAASRASPSAPRGSTSSARAP